MQDWMQQFKNYFVKQPAVFMQLAWA